MKVSPMRGIFFYGKKGKSIPRYIKSFKILERVRNLTYRPSLNQVQMFSTFPITLGTEVASDATYEERLVKILEYQTK